MLWRWPKIKAEYAHWDGASRRVAVITLAYADTWDSWYVTWTGIPGYWICRRDLDRHPTTREQRLLVRAYKRFRKKGVDKRGKIR